MIVDAWGSCLVNFLNHWVQPCDCGCMGFLFSEFLKPLIKLPLMSFQVDQVLVPWEEHVLQA